MSEAAQSILLRPGITNPGLWYPDRPPESEWRRIRKIVMERADWTCASCGHRALKWMNTHHVADSGDHTPDNLAPVCVACHAVLHLGRSLSLGTIEVWKCELSQVEIVRRTREGVRQGLSLTDIKGQLPLSPGLYKPTSVQYANDLIRTMGDAPRAYLDEPLCAVFTDLNRWQIEG